MIIYKNTPPEIMDIIKRFHQNNLSYLLFKCEHIFAGENKNMDVLFETEEDYRKAARLLLEKGFVLRMSEKVEKYKSMYCGLLNGILYSVHLHREIAWHGIKALGKSLVFERKKIVKANPAIIIPSLEDSILIHAGHILFENFAVTGKEETILKKINDSGINHAYIREQLSGNHWETGFQKVILCQNQLRKKDIFVSWLGKLSQEPFTAAYFSKKAILALLRKVDFRRKGCLISLSGVNGSGKSTLARKVLEKYKEITAHLGVRQHYYYFGWKPEMPLTKLLSKLFKKRDAHIFKKINYSENVKKFDLFQELLFTYSFTEFYYRYLKNIRPRLRRGDMVITDRYFYDFYGQYPYAKNSLILKPLLKLFPKPDFSYVLDAELGQIIKRKKINENTRGIQEIHREAMPVPYLQRQRENYLYLTTLLNATKIENGENLDENAKKIISGSWRELIK